MKGNSIALPTWAVEGAKVLASGSGYHESPGIITGIHRDMARLVVLLDQDAGRPSLNGTYFPAEGVEVFNG